MNKEPILNNFKTKTETFQLKIHNLSLKLLDFKEKLTRVILKCLNWNLMELESKMRDLENKIFRLMLFVINNLLKLKYKQISSFKS